MGTGASLQAEPADQTARGSTRREGAAVSGKARPSARTTGKSRRSMLLRSTQSRGPTAQSSVSALDSSVAITCPLALARVPRARRTMRARRRRTRYSLPDGLTCPRACARLRRRVPSRKRRPDDDLGSAGVAGVAAATQAPPSRWAARHAALSRPVAIQPAWRVPALAGPAVRLQQRRPGS
jgi:hypothetical protein